MGRLVGELPLGMALPLLLLRAAALARASSGEPDCQLNGAAPPGSAHCVCDRGWKGAACGQLDVAAEPAVAYGAGSPLAENHSSWGGGPPVFDGKQWHLFVSEIAAHCGMQCWSRLSQATHAVSASPTGPFRRRGVVIPTQTHNTYYAYSKPDRVHLLYHIFSGTSPRSCSVRAHRAMVQQFSLSASRLGAPSPVILMRLRHLAKRAPCSR